MSNNYTVYLDNIKIGSTDLENADAPMGVVFGVIKFLNSDFDYTFLKEYCIKNKVDLANDYPEDKLISTSNMSQLTIINKVGIEISGIGNQITIMGGEESEISIQGIPYPFYEEEFPHHVKEYNEMFKEK